MKLSTCCQALPHNLYPTHCSDCKEYSEFEDTEEEVLITEKDREEIQQCALLVSLEPGLKAMSDLLYSSKRLQHAAAEAGDEKLLYRHTLRAEAILEAITAFQDALGLTPEETDTPH